MKKMRNTVLFTLLSLGAIALLVLLLQNAHLVILDPQGAIAAQQRDLIVIVTLLMLVVVLPVFILTIYITWKYREGNTKATYRPDWDHDMRLEALWWGVPTLIILVVSGIIWTSSHELDPYKTLASDTKPITIKVVAMEWKWLFIYPEQQIATVNYVHFPEDTPVTFEITGDAPMNSFWIPSLGGQVYAMAGMQTKLHLIADEPDTFSGSSANLSGEGFAGMKFVARASSRAEFDAWVQSTQQSLNYLNYHVYKKLAQPSQNMPPTIYALKQNDLYDTIMMKYTMPGFEAQQRVKEEMDAMPPMVHKHAHGTGHDSHQH